MFHLKCRERVAPAARAVATACRLAWLRIGAPSALGLASLLLPAFALTGVEVFTSPAAWAHGGPPLPPPEPPKPPPKKPDVPPMPPPPPSQPPPPVKWPPGVPRPGMPPTTPPTTGPTGANPGATPPGRGAFPPGTWRDRVLPGRRRALGGPTVDDGAWQTWWLLARGQWLPDRDAARLRVPITPQGPLARVGEGGAGARDASQAQHEALTTRVALPLLLELGGKATKHADLRASSLLALARLSTCVAARETVLAAVREHGAPDLVRESAALALGLFRRSQTELQLPACDLDLLRDAALELIDDHRAPERARAFAAYALALLGDQPFTAPTGEPQGQALALRLWARLARPSAASDLPVALLTALGHQPVGALPLTLREGLRSLVVGRPALGRRWDDRERSHALTALARLEPGTSAVDLLRVLGRRREAEEVTRAAALAVGAHAEAWTSVRRAESWPVVLNAYQDARDPWTRSLLILALGRVMSADLADGSQAVASMGGVRLLLEATKGSALAERGYAGIALALAGRSALDQGMALDWVARVKALLLEGLADEGQDDGLRASHAVALGILGDVTTARHLVAVVGDRDVGPQTRGHGAVALAQIDARSPEVLRALVVTLSERTHEDLRAQAALSLSWLHAREALPLLLRQATDPDSSEQLLAQAAVALGRLGDLGSVGALADIARDEKRGEIGRALAVVALGLVLDPEPRPSLLRLAVDANYPARTASLHELFTIL